MFSLVAQFSRNNSSSIEIVWVVVLFAALILGYVLSSFLISRVFAKASVAQWKAWVPVVNNWTLYELGSQNGRWALAPLLPLLALPFIAFEQTVMVAVIILFVSYIVAFVSGIIMFLAMYDISRKFGKSEWFILWAIFLPLVWFAILGFDDSKWQGNLTKREDSTK
ncbi:hypothetical protein B7Z28_00300 [Candidatus Saccharibacteria bacterium 32-45-3]|nr:MAG: hypothetical protein B7Z28_00300 [Candidatus Saccharibacteria bacterium 32-45-3]